MKKIMMSLMAAAWLAAPASAQSNGRNDDPVPANDNCPAATCTDHSYDQAYSTRRFQGYRSPATQKRQSSTVATESNFCPAATCTDHSYDAAYSSQWADRAQSPRTSVVRVSSAPAIRTWGGMRDRRYNLNNVTVRERYPVTMNAPYNGKDAPSYDGAAKNMYRNMRANNESEPLPANNGQ